MEKNPETGGSRPVFETLPGGVDFAHQKWPSSVCYPANGFAGHSCRYQTVATRKNGIRWILNSNLIVFFTRPYLA